MRSQPVYLNFFTLKFPVTAIASILHRLSGVFLFLIIPYMLTALSNLMLDTKGILQLQPLDFSTSWMKVLLWFGASSLIYHLLAGIRHLIMDAGYAESKIAGRITAYLVIICSAIISILVGFKLC